MFKKYDTLNKSWFEKLRAKFLTCIYQGEQETGTVLGVGRLSK